MIPDVSTGIGFDAHRFADSGERCPLWLACLQWDDGTPGIAGDSDGDVAVHALIDAMLSASHLGDIGSHFGQGPQSKGAGMHGDEMLRWTADFLREHGWSLINASVVVVARAPRLSARRDQAQEAMSRALGAPVSLTATTTDGLGFTGSGEGVAAMATALVRRREAV